MASKSATAKAKAPAKEAKEKNVSYTIACLPSERAAWFAAARKLDRSVSWWVRRACNAALAAEAKEEAANAALSH